MPVTEGPLILVIDPDESLRELFRDLFLLEGYAVDLRPAASLEAMRGTDPVAVVYGLAWGDEAASIVGLRSLLDQRPPSCAVVLCTADPSQIQAHQAELDVLGIPIVSKPFDIEDVLGVIRDGIGSLSADGRLDGQPLFLSRRCAD